MTIEKMYGSYSDADLNDWERFPMNANVLTSSAFGAWLLRRDERRDKAILKADYENRLNADMVAMLVELQMDIEECVDGGEGSPQFELGVSIAQNQVLEMIQEKINALKAKEGEK